MSFGQWGSRYLNAVTLSVYAGLLITALSVITHADRYETWFICAFISLFLGLFAWRFNFKHLLAIAENPTATIAAAAQGYVELSGRARNRLPLKSPLQGESCVWFRYWVYAKDQNDIWRLADYRSSEQIFEIEDATGRCVVNPQNAEVIATDRHQIIQNDHKYIEELLYSGGSIYVLGEIETITEQTIAEQISQEVGQLLTQWKKSPVNLKFRFDLDGNGEIDMHEWELARSQARIEVLEKNGILNKQEVNLIRAPDDGRMFLISGISPMELRGRYQFWTRLHLLLSWLAGLIILLITYGHRHVALW